MYIGTSQTNLQKRVALRDRNEPKGWGILDTSKKILPIGVISATSHTLLCYISNIQHIAQLQEEAQRKYDLKDMEVVEIGCVGIREKKGLKLACHFSKWLKQEI